MKIIFNTKLFIFFLQSRFIYRGRHHDICNYSKCSTVSQNCSRISNLRAAYLIRFSITCTLRPVPLFVTPEYKSLKISPSVEPVDLTYSCVHQRKYDILTLVHPIIFFLFSIFMVIDTFSSIHSCILFNIKLYYTYNIEVRVM